jgi:hypothetical protein
MVPFDTKPSAGQEADVPVQCSARSQTDPLARHRVVAGATASGGQEGETPLHVSATSQIDAAARQTNPDRARPQTPSAEAPAAAAQVWHVPVQALSQHTKPTQ